MLSIEQLAQKYRSGSITPTEFITQQLLDLEYVNKKINAVAHFLPKEDILKLAKQSTLRFQNNTPLSIFDGIPITVKDISNNQVQGLTINNGSLVPGICNQKPKSTSAHIQILLTGGAIILCQTTTCEVGFKGTTSSLRTGITRSAHNLLRTSGGSSGGAASLTAAGIGCLNLGSDGGGSLRIPAACNGVLGFKPSFGIGYQPTFPYISCVGPIARFVDDIKLYFSEMLKHNQQWNAVQSGTGFEEQFSRLYSRAGSSVIDQTRLQLMNSDGERQFDIGKLRKLRIGVSRNLGGLYERELMDARILENLDNMVDYLRDTQGFTNIEYCEPVTFGGAENAHKFAHMFSTIWACDKQKKYSQYLSGIENDVTLTIAEKEAKLKLIDPLLYRSMPKHISADDLYKCVIDRDEIRHLMAYFFHEHQFDLLIMPTLPILPPRARSAMGDDTHSDAIQPLSTFTSIWNITQQPALSIHSGFVKVANETSPVPIGIQIVGKLYGDWDVIHVAKVLENKYKTIVAKL